MKRRRRKGSLDKTIPLIRLMNSQPGPLSRHPRYSEMIQHYNLSDSLRRIRISRRCYTLLNRAVIEPENLVHFYKTYRLPRDSFFPLFLMIKRDYLKEKERKAFEKETFILTEMKKMDAGRRRVLRYLAEWEDTLNWKSEHPLWEKSLYPATKKRVRELLNYDEPEWTALIRDHIEAMIQRYPRIRDSEILSCCLILRIFPSLPLQQPPTRDEINRAYRKLCRLHHPDSGGRDGQFILLGQSRDFLISLVHSKED